MDIYGNIYTLLNQVILLNLNQQISYLYQMIGKTNPDNDSVRNNAVNGSIKTVIILNRGENRDQLVEQNLQEFQLEVMEVVSECTIITNNDRRVESITISNQGSNYTYGSVDLSAGSVPEGDVQPVFDVINVPTGRTWCRYISRVRCI